LLGVQIGVEIAVGSMI